MELIGSSGYQVASNETKNWRLFMNFMLSDGTSYKDSTDTTNDIVGQMFFDLACYLLSSVGVGPVEIVVVPRTDKFTYVICM